MNNAPITDLEQRLQGLADGYHSPLVPISADLERGRRRARRRRRSVGVGIAAAALLVAAPLVGTPWEERPAPVSGVPDGTPAGNELTDEVTLPLAPDTSNDPVPDWARVDEDAAIAVRRAIAGHLDPSGTHISESSITDTQAVSVGSEDQKVLTEHWHTFDWSVPGEPVRGGVQVKVSSIPLVDCNGSGVVCEDVLLDGLEVVRVEDDPSGGAGDLSWTYEREDGYFVQVAITTRAGTDVSAVSVVDLSDKQLAAVLADSVLDLPGHPAPPDVDRLSSTRLRDVARDVLGERLHGKEYWSADSWPYWHGKLRAPLTGSVDVQQYIAAYDFNETCDEANRIRCTVGTIDGYPVRVDEMTTIDAANGGFKVMYGGPTRQIEVWVDAEDAPGSSLSIEDGIRLATDPRLQS